MAEPGWICEHCRMRNDARLDGCTYCGRPRSGSGETPVVDPGTGIDARSIREIDERHRLVVYVSVDSPDVVSVFNFALAADLAALAADGWHAVSVSVYPLRAGGTMGSFFSQGGGNYTTVLGATVLLERADPA